MITFAVEPWSDIKHEILPRWQEHHADVADRDDADRIPLDPDWAKYESADERGQLQILAGRERGELVGYVFAFIDTHLHYRTTLCAFTDIYWVRSSHRGHWTGVRMFRAHEAACRARGVVKLFGGHKIWLDVGPIFRRCGWKETERCQTKWIGN